jgi:hypothetical protein
LQKKGGAHQGSYADGIGGVYVRAGGNQSFSDLRSRRVHQDGHAPLDASVDGRLKETAIGISATLE